MRRMAAIQRVPAAPGTARPFGVFVATTLIGFFAMMLVVSAAGPAVRTTTLEPLAMQNPTIGGCYFFPDPRSNRSFFCGDDNSQPSIGSPLYAYLGVPIQFSLNVSSPTGSPMNVTMYFDTRLNFTTFTPEVLNASAVQTFPVTRSAANVSVPIPANWTYWQLSNDTISTNVSSYYTIFANVSDANGSDPFDPGGCSRLPYGNCFFKVAVAVNSPPTMDGLQSVIPAPSIIKFPNPVIPLVYANVSVRDDDNDNITVTWDWGDGTRTVNQTGPAVSAMSLNVTHQYAKSLFPLNETPRFVNFTLRVWVDDGVPAPLHNSSTDYVVQFEQGYDWPPSAIINSPTVGSRWKIGETVPMRGRVSDPERDNLTVYWDFGDGSKTASLYASGNVTSSHAYLVAGNYAVTLWVTDGPNKKLCFDEYCANSTDHWSRAAMPISVLSNRAPLAVADNRSGLIGEPILLHAVVADEDGDNLTVRWSFGDNSTAVNVTVGTRWDAQPFPLLQEHIYTDVGVYNLTVHVDDGTSQTMATARVTVLSFNEPPLLSPVVVLRANRTVAANNTFLIDETVVIQLTMKDPENDPLEVTIDWGDGNVTRVDITLTGGPDCTINESNETVCYFSYAYQALGTYLINVTLTDHRVYLAFNQTGGLVTRSHTPMQSATVIVAPPSQPRAEDLWDWWDYSTLTLVLGGIAILVGRGAWQVHQERRED